MLNLLRCSLIRKCRESVKRTERLILEEGTRGVLESWTLLLWELAEDFEEADLNIHHLQHKIKTKERIHDEDLQVFEEMQSQLEEEYEKKIEKERADFRKIARRLQEELQSKEEELEKAMEIKSELIDRINTIFKKKNSIKNGKAALIKEKETLLEDIERQKEKIEQLEKELKETKKILADETEKCFQEGIRIGRKLAATEEIGVLEELEILKEIEQALEGHLVRTDSEITLSMDIDDAG